MSRTHRWVWIAGPVTLIVIVVGIAAAWWLTSVDQTKPDCPTVRAMIDYNKSKGRILANAFNPEQGTEPSVGDYQNWANHLQTYANSITDPDLAPHAHQLADEANQMVTLVRQARNDTSVPADPQAPPPWAEPYAKLSRQFRSELQALDKACPVR